MYLLDADFMKGRLLLESSLYSNFISVYAVSIRERLLIKDKMHLVHRLLRPLSNYS